MVHPTTPCTDRFEEAVRDKFKSLLLRVREDIKSMAPQVKELEGHKTMTLENIRESEKLLEDEKENETTEIYREILRKLEQEKRRLARIDTTMSYFVDYKKRLMKIKKDIRKQTKDHALQCPRCSSWL